MGKKQDGAKAKGVGGKKGIDLMSAWQCTECNEACDGENGEIECFVCKNWTHMKCGKISDEMLNMLALDNLQWICKRCLNQTEKNPKEVDLQSRTEAQLSKLLDLVPLIHSLKTKIERIEDGLGIEKLEEKIEEVVDRKLAAALEEHQEIEKRKRNILIVNLKESAKTSIEERKEDDIEAARNLLSKLTEVGEETLKEPIRLGKVGGHRPRMLRLTVNTEEKKREIMRKAPELNLGVTEAKNKIYVNHDLTQKQREKNKELRAELARRTGEGEENLAIRGGKIVTVKKQEGQNNAKRRDEEGGAVGGERAQNK
jgi:hypothetical protein